MINKTNFILVLLVCLIHQAKGQNDTINRTTDEGHKYGLWREYFNNGNIKKEGRYKIISSPLSKEDLFFLGIIESDSIVSSSIKVGEWKKYNIVGKTIRSENFRDGYSYDKEEYIYDKNGNLHKTIRNNRSILFGIGQDLEINPLHFYNIGSIGSTQINNLKINSLSNNKTEVIISGFSNNIYLKNTLYTIEPNSSINIPFFNSIDRGNINDTLSVALINPDTLLVNIIIESYGYSLSSSNLQMPEKEIKTYIIETEKLNYYREFDECEMKIYKYSEGLTLSKIKKENIKPFLVFPLSADRNVIDIDKLKKGNYLLRVIDYRNEIDLLTIIKRE